MKLSTRIATINGAPGADDGWRVLNEARARIDRGLPTTMLCIGDHDTPTPDTILDATKTALSTGNTGYAPVDGVRPLREAIAQRTETRTGIPTHANEVFVAGGGQGALFAAMMGAIDPGQTAVIIDPYYTTYPQTVRATSGQLKIVRADPDRGFQIDRDTLLSATEGATALLVNSPNNPTGAIYDDTTLAAIREACLTHDLWCLSDEVYETQIHDGRHISPRQLPNMAERTLVINSLSKSHVMTGFRLGWLIGPHSFIDPIVSLTNATTYGTPGFIQDAALAALADPATEADTAALYTARRNAALAALRETNALGVSPPSGAMYVMLDIRPTGFSGEAFALRLLDTHGIACMPGESFGEAAAGHLRVALTQPEDVLIPALKTIASFAESLTP